ncbi:hypothetical protein [Mycolicibacterium thermoresistibile]
MGIMPDTSPYGGQTVTGPGWPNVDEDALAAAAMSYETLAAKLSGTVVPQQQGQMMQLSDTWEGSGATAAVGEASTIIAGHEANAAHAAAIAAKLRSMEAAVIQAKMAANAVAVETQRECEAIAASPFPNKQELLQSRIAMGLGQNSTQVTASSTELANTLGVPPTIPTAGGAPAGVPGQEAAGDGAQQAAQMASQMAGMAAQIPAQVGQLVGQVPQQLSQPLQQLSQPLQQITSLFGGMGGSGSGGLNATPFSSYSNHPLAGGSGPSGGAGMVRAASLPGAGGSSPQTPLMANMLGGKASPVSVDTGAVAGTAVAGGVAPVAAGMGGGGMGMAPGMMGARGTSGGNRPGIAAPEALEYDLGEDDDDDW